MMESAYELAARLAEELTKDPAWLAGFKKLARFAKAEKLAVVSLRPPLDHLRHLLRTRFPVLYGQILEPTLADLRLEHSATLADGHPWKARCVLLQGCGALAAAAICQFGYSLLGRIAALWQARSPK